MLTRITAGADTARRLDFDSYRRPIITLRSYGPPPTRCYFLGSHIFDGQREFVDATILAGRWIAMPVIEGSSISAVVIAGWLRNAASE